MKNVIKNLMYSVLIVSTLGAGVAWGAAEEPAELTAASKAEDAATLALRRAINTGAPKSTILTLDLQKKLAMAKHTIVAANYNKDNLIAYKDSIETNIQSLKLALNNVLVFSTKISSSIEPTGMTEEKGEGFGLFD